MFDRRIGQYAVTEVEDEWALPKGVENGVHGIVECFSTDEKRKGIEITLNRTLALDVLARER
jgi:hypothetical protein